VRDASVNRSEDAMHIRLARHDDFDSIWQILRPTIRAGETHALPNDLSEPDAIAYWMGPDRESFVAEKDGLILGTFYRGLAESPHHSWVE